MKKIKPVICLLLFILCLASCSKTPLNAEYFIQKIDSAKVDIPEEMRYLPELLSDYDAPENVNVSTMAEETMTTLAYFVRASLTGESGLEYQYINAHIQLRDTDISSSLSGIVDSYNEEGVKAVLYKSGKTEYAVSYSITNSEITVVNIIYPVSEFITAFYTLEVCGISEINDKTIQKICEDVQVIKL